MAIVYDVEVNIEKVFLDEAGEVTDTNNLESEVWGTFDSEEEARELIESMRGQESQSVPSEFEELLSQAKRIERDQDKQRAYVNSDGMVCPVCDGKECDEFGQAEHDEGLIIQPVRCLICKSAWTDNYELVGFSDLELKAKP